MNEQSNIHIGLNTGMVPLVKALIADVVFAQY